METIVKHNAINWFELYAADFERATAFYAEILGSKLEVMDTPSGKMGMFPCNMECGVGGSITNMEGCKPGPGGTLVYINVEGDLDGVIERIPAAGGKIVRPRMAIPPHGFIAIFEDSEGNVVGLHSMT